MQTSGYVVLLLSHLLTFMSVCGSAQKCCDNLQVTLTLVPGALLAFVAAIAFLRHKNLIGI